MIIDWSDRDRECWNGGGYLTKVGGDTTGVVAKIQRECWNGGSYMTKVGRGITVITRDIQSHHTDDILMKPCVNQANTFKLSNPSIPITESGSQTGNDERLIRKPPDKGTLVNWFCGTCIFNLVSSRYVLHPGSLAIFCYLNWLPMDATINLRLSSLHYQG